MYRFIFSLVALTLLITTSTFAGTLYSLHSNGVADGTIYTLDQSTGAETLLGPVGAWQFPGDLTSDTRSATFTIWANDITTNTLLKINPLTGAATSVGVFTTQGAITSLAFDITTGRMYGTTSSTYSGEPDRLYAIDHNTAIATPVGAGVGFSNIWGLAFNNLGKLYGVANNTNQLVLIDTATGAGGLVGPVSLTSVFDIATRPEDNTTFAVNAFTNQLYKLDLTSGGTTLVGSHISPHNMVGLAFGPAGPAVPLPASVWGGMALMAVVVGVRKLRRRGTH